MLELNREERRKLRRRGREDTVWWIENTLGSELWDRQRDIAVAVSVSTLFVIGNPRHATASHRSHQRDGAAAVEGCR